MTVCEGLEAQLTIAQTESRRLLEAVLHEALADTNSEVHDSRFTSPGSGATYQA
jgi:hypothetical protein